MSDNSLNVEERNEIGGSGEKKNLVKLFIYAGVFLAGLGALTACNMGGHPIAALFFMAIALGALAFFLGALRSDN